MFLYIGADRRYPLKCTVWIDFVDSWISSVTSRDSWLQLPRQNIFYKSKHILPGVQTSLYCFYLVGPGTSSGAKYHSFLCTLMQKVAEATWAVIDISRPLTGWKRKGPSSCSVLTEDAPVFREVHFSRGKKRRAVGSPEATHIESADFESYFVDIRLDVEEPTMEAASP